MSFDPFLCQLYSINYPSLRDQNILRRVLVSEVLYWAEKLKGRWLEQKRDYSFTLCQTEGRGEECLGVSERRMEMENKQTGEHPQRLFSVPKIVVYSILDNMETNIENSRFSKK